MVGRLKNYQLKLHIDPQVTPVKDKVTAKVKELLENDIIQRVEETIRGYMLMCGYA